MQIAYKSGDFMCKNLEGILNLIIKILAEEYWYLTNDNHCITVTSHDDWDIYNHRKLDCLLKSPNVGITGPKGNTLVTRGFPHKRPGERFKNVYEFLNLRALKISMLYKDHTFQCMGKIFCVEFQRVPLKFHTNILPKNWKRFRFYSQVKISELLDLTAHKCFWNAPQ